MFDDVNIFFIFLFTKLICYYTMDVWINNKYFFVNSAIPYEII